MIVVLITIQVVTVVIDDFIKNAHILLLIRATARSDDTGFLNYQTT